MQYSPLFVVTFIRDMLQALFLEYGGVDFAWDNDVRKSKILIGTVNDVHADTRVQQLPRILVQRGPTQLVSQFISNNRAGTTGGGLSRGGAEQYRQDVHGDLTLIIEARQEGLCEELGEYVRQFICWSKPYIEAQFGFQAFGKQIALSTCDMDQEDTEKFKITINIPYIVEDNWEVTGNLTRLNHIFDTLTQK